MTAFRFSTRALQDLAEIQEYLLIHAPHAEAEILAEILDAAERVAAHPGLGHRRRDLTPVDVWFYPVFSYLMVFRKESPTQIVAILHGARNLRSELRQRKKDEGQ